MLIYVYIHIYTYILTFVAKMYLFILPETLQSVTAFKYCYVY